MPERRDPESIEERNLRILIPSTLTPAAPPLSAGLPAQLASRARGGITARIDGPLAAAICSTAGMVILALLLLLPSGRMDLLRWVAAVPAVNVLLSPFAAYIVIRNMRREISNAKT